jgi:misacylated tRNA(Ala) deacylase
MMTQALYQEDSYLKSFETKISGLDSEKNAITLEQTAFYPSGGGQPSDRGSLRAGEIEYIVNKVKRAGSDIYHFIEAGQPLPAPGIIVKGQIDWDHRYKLMRTHTALHILCGVIFRDYGASVTGGNMEPLKGRMDFEFETMHKELVKKIQESVNKEVANARPVKISILPREEAFQIPDLIRTKINLLPKGIKQVRVVEIEGLDIQADGGTHVKNTSEVGSIRVVDYKSKGKINKRIYIEVE